MNRFKRLKSERGVTLVELLISIGVGSILITMLMSILSTTLLTKNKIDHENRLYDEAYYISEYIQSRVFELGVRSVEDISKADSNDQVIELRHEYEVVQEGSSGLIYRDPYDAEAFILHYDHSEQSLHYGNAEKFDYTNQVFSNPEETRINSANVAVEETTNIGFDEGEECILFGPIERIVDEETTTIEDRCLSAIIRLNITLTYRINDNPLFKPMTFESTIVF